MYGFSGREQTLGLIWSGTETENKIKKHTFLRFALGNKIIIYAYAQDKNVIKAKIQLYLLCTLPSLNCGTWGYWKL